MVAKKGEQPKKTKTPADVEEEGRRFSLTSVKQFSAEVKAEFNKIVWPDKKVTMGSTGVVIVLVFIISLYLGAVDLFIGKMVGFILR